MTNYIEQDCTIEHEGRKFSAGGAVVTEQFITAYLKEDHKLTDWHGKTIGMWFTLSSWPIHSYITDRMYSVECFVNGVRYVGRGAGVGMSVNAKRSPKQPKPIRLLECGCCGEFHPEGRLLKGGSANYQNDCRYDANRFSSDQDFRTRTGLPCIEVSMDEQDFGGDSASQSV